MTKTQVTSMASYLNSKNMDRRISRKTKRGQVLLQQALPGISFQDKPSPILAILNVGHTTGGSRELIYDRFKNHGKLKSISIIRNMSFCFVEMHDVKEASAAYEALHGSDIQVGDSNQQLYLGYVQAGSNFHNISEPERVPPPHGLTMFEEFVSEEEEVDLLSRIGQIQSSQEESGSESLKHRTVLHFGYNFDYATNNVDRTKDREDLPAYLSRLIERMREKNLSNFSPDQVTVNIYEPGQGIPHHVDTHSAFEEDLVSLSLGSPVVMDFKHPSGKKSEVLLRDRSLLIMREEARYVWKHGIVPRVSDIISSDSEELTCMKRGRRISITFRQVRWKPCSCKFTEHCDRKEQQEIDEKVADQLEKLHVFNVYDVIAGHFSATRHSPWPGVTNFLSAVEEGSILLDVGCGNAKYFGVSKGVFEIGCDRSTSLLGIANGRGFQVFTADCREIPIRSGLVDYIICIAVIHHLPTTARRLLALTQMARLLCPGGRCLVSVWSKDQGNSKYLQESRNSEEDDVRGGFDLPVHKNRTRFAHGDVLVPWTLRAKGNGQESDSVYHRYYHVFEEHEFRQLCEDIPGVNVCEIFREQGNWIVIFEKRK